MVDSVESDLSCVRMCHYSKVTFFFSLSGHNLFSFAFIMSAVGVTMAAYIREAASESDICFHSARNCRGDVMDSGKSSIIFLLYYFPILSLFHDTFPTKSMPV